MKIRNLSLSLAAMAISTAVANAQNAFGPGGGSGPACGCVTTESGGGWCAQDWPCATAILCGPGQPACPAGMECAIDSCCGVPTCAPACPNPGNCPVGGNCAAGFPACEAAPVPTVSEWGLVVLTLIGCIAGTVLFGIVRRRAQPTA